MITCFKGRVNLKGDSLNIISEYICITASMINILKGTIASGQITDEEKVACDLMAVMGTAFDSSKLSNSKNFYEVIEFIAKHEKDGRV